MQDRFPNAYIHRFKQSRRGEQNFDLVIIRKKDPVFIECKSRDVSDRSTYKLISLFKEGQLERQLKILNRTKLRGYLAFEMRRGRGHPKKATLIPLREYGEEKIDLEKIDKGVEIKRKSGEYQIPQELEVVK